MMIIVFAKQKTKAGKEAVQKNDLQMVNDPFATIILPVCYSINTVSALQTSQSLPLLYQTNKLQHHITRVSVLTVLEVLNGQPFKLGKPSLLWYRDKKGH